jgi:hypothetical protein
MTLRVSVAVLWFVTALISALLPHESGVLALLARCGFEGEVGIAVWIASCLLNTALALAILRRPGAWTYAVQIGAVLGYTLTAAVNMPELTIDHCGPLLKNVPLLALLLMLWLATPSPAPAPPTRRVTKTLPSARYSAPAQHAAERRIV